MRAAPAFQVSLHRFGVWRAAVAALATVAVATLAAWLMTRDAPVGTAMGLGAAAALVTLAALTASLLHTPPRQLRWDGVAWYLGPGRGASSPGALLVAVDLGGWMLLRFVAAAPARAVWLPVQRRGLESQWHALRCSVYSPRLAPGDDATEP